MIHFNTRTGFYLSMTALKGFSFLFLLLFSVTLFGQTRITGTVQQSNATPIVGVEVYNTTSTAKTVTDANGVFTIEVKEGIANQFVLYKDGYELLETSISVGQNSLLFTLEKINNLSEVVIQNQRAKLFNLNKLRDVEETAIYAGKKTEVVSISKLTANKAINNARQIFGQVVGLTINEGSEGGLQLSIGGRGLNPNRTSNFNTRQNGYDISADVLGYPESYYATPTEALDEIQIVRGAASLQYGTQFGGLVNFKITVLGEVTRPGPYIINDLNPNILTAIGLAGDLTLYGKRDNILVVRNFDGTTTKERINLMDASFINSPFYQLIIIHCTLC